MTVQTGRIDHGRPLRIAIAGAGLMGRWHGHAARRAGAEIVAVIDTDTERASGLAARFGATAFDAFGKTREKTEPDVLHICTPSPSHAGLIEEAAGAGMHVFCEKPLAEDAAETERALAAVEQAGVLLCPAHQYAFQEPIEKALARRDRFGGLVDVALTFNSAGGMGMPSEALPGLAADILPHPLSVLQRFFPDVDISEADWKLLSGAPDTWQFTAVCDEVQLRILISLAARPTEARLVMSGRTAGFQADLFHGYGYFIDGQATRHSKITQPFRRAGSEFLLAGTNLAARAIRREPAYPGLRSLISRFYAACRGEAPSPITPAEIRQVAVLRDRFLSGAGAGRA